MVSSPCPDRATLLTPQSAWSVLVWSWGDVGVGRHRVFSVVAELDLGLCPDPTFTRN